MPPVRTLVATLADSRSIRGVIILAVIGLVLGAGVLYKPFQVSLDYNIVPPTNSPSGVAKAKALQYFKADAMKIIVHIHSRDGSPLVNGTSSGAIAPLSRAAERVSNDVRQHVEAITGKGVGQCETSFASYWALPAPIRRLGKPQVIAQPLFAKNESHTLLVATISSCALAGTDGTVDWHPVPPGCFTSAVPACAPIGTLSDSLTAYAHSGSYSADIAVEVVSLDDVFTAALGGIDETMLVSTATAPLAFGILAAVLRNVRLLILPLINILACVSGTIVVMYVISQSYDVSSQSPALIIACALAMNIDYGLFLLTRLNREVHDRRRPLEESVVTMLETSGHTVLVSGLTLTLCFLGMLLVPITTIASMGISAAITVTFAIVAALFFTPTLLFTFPRFFLANRRYGFTLDDTCCGREVAPAAPAVGTRGSGSCSDTSSTHGGSCAPFAGAPTAATPKLAALVDPLLVGHGDSGCTPQGSEGGSSSSGCSGSGDAGARGPTGTGSVQQPNSRGSYVSFGKSVSSTRSRGMWEKLGAALQRPWLALLVLGALGGIAVPFVRPLLDLKYVEGVQPLLPRGGKTTDAFFRLQDDFGISSVFPSTIVLVPPSDRAVTHPDYLRAACEAMRWVSANVTASMANSSTPYTMQASDFSGLMMFGGQCLGRIERLIEWLPGEGMHELLDALIAMFGNPEHTATKISVSTTLDPFSAEGREWIKAMRVALDVASATPVNISGAGVPMGRMYLIGMPMEQMDGSAETFASLPRVVGATLAIVCVVLLVAFRSIVVPIRSVLCLTWMLVVTFGSAALVYQHGALEALGLSNLSPTGGGALFWMSPCIAFSFVVGLGLDYDIFLTESAVEFYDHGASPKEAVILALRSTGNIICLAGVIMTLAFGALLAGKSAALNQLGFLLILGVLIDCFITTKFVIPAVMALLPWDLNFWPRRRPRHHVAAEDTAAVMPIDVSAPEGSRR